MLLSGAKRLSCLCIRIKEDSQNCTKYHGIKLSSHKMKLPGRIIEQNLWHDKHVRKSIWFDAKRRWRLYPFLGG